MHSSVFVIVTFCNKQKVLSLLDVKHTQEQYRSPVPEADGSAIDQVWAKWGAGCSTRPRQSNLDH